MALAGRLCQPDRPGAPTGVSVTVPDATHIIITGPDKQAVGQFAAIVRRSGPPNLTRARGFATMASSSAARPARPSVPSSPRLESTRAGTGDPASTTATSGLDRAERGPREITSSVPVEDRPVNTAIINCSCRLAGWSPAPVRNDSSGTPERPRLAVFRSSKHIYAQMVNDQSGTTLASASCWTRIKAQAKYGGNKAAAALVGRVVAERAKKAGIDKICFDRRATSTTAASRAGRGRARGGFEVLTAPPASDRPRWAMTRMG